MTTERNTTAGGRWADTKEMERQGSRNGLGGDADDPSTPLNPNNQGTVKKPTTTNNEKVTTGKTKNGYKIKVLLLDGNEYSVVLPAAATGQTLFDNVCKHINLVEKDYFSLSYRDRNDIKFWVNHTKKLTKQQGSQPYVYTFEVKFYPTEPESMHEDFTRYLLFLQLRTDILSDRLPCSFVTHALLASYAVQSDLGDYDTDDHGSSFDYIKNIDFSSKQNEELLEKVAELHKTHRGLTPEEAELEYLNNAKKLAMYGIELHPAKDMAGDDVMIGVCASGLLVFKDKLRIHRFSWPKILKISYKRNNFYIQVRPGEFDQVKNKLAYKLTNYTMAKKLWKIAVEHHTFFRLKEPESASRAAFPLFGSKFRYSGRTQYQSRNAPKDGDRSKTRVDRSASRRFAPTKPFDANAPTFSTERKEEVITSPEYASNTINLRNLTKQRNTPLATVEDDQNLTGMDEGQVSFMRNPGSPNYSQAGWAKDKSPGYGGGSYQGTPWEHQGFQLCDQAGRPLRKNHTGPIYIKFGKPIAPNDQELYDLYGKQVPSDYNGHVFDRTGNLIAESPDDLNTRYGNPINRPGHRGPVFGEYGRPQLHDLFDGVHTPVKPGHDGPVYDKFGNPLVPVEIVYGKSMKPAGYDKSGYQLCDEYGYPVGPSHEGQIFIKYGMPLARGTHELCDINGFPVSRDHDGPVYDRWGNLIAPGIENLYDEYGIPINIATHNGPVFGRYGVPLNVEMYDKDGRPIRPGHRGQIYNIHRQIIIPLEVYDDGTYGDSTVRRHGPPTLEKPIERVSRLSGMNVRDSRTSPFPEGEEGLPPYQDPNNPYSVTTTTRTTTRTYRGPDGTMVTEHKTERDGVVETRIQKKTTIITQVEGSDDIDFDRLLSTAIAGVTELNPDYTVEKIEIHTEGQ